MPDKFSVILPKDWQKHWPEVQRAAHKYNFDIEKNGNDIAFSGYGIEGNIRITGNTAHVTIDKRPFFLSKEMIVNQVKRFLQSYG